MNELLHSPFFQRALAAAAFIGFANGFFSGFIVLRRTALSVSRAIPYHAARHRLRHPAHRRAHPLERLRWRVVCHSVCRSGTVAVARGNRVAQGTALAVLYTSAFAAGVAILPHLHTRQELKHWLFGDISAIGNADLWIAFCIGSITVLFGNLLMRPILITLFEPNIAAAQGVPVRFIQYLLFALLALSLVGSLQAVGCVLSVGLLVAPRRPFPCSPIKLPHCSGAEDFSAHSGRSVRFCYPPALASLPVREL